MSTTSREGKDGEPVVKTFPLNSKRLTAEVLSRIARGLGLPINASAAETRQLIEGKLEEQKHEPRNVQVDVIETSGDIAVKLRGESGIILEVPSDRLVDQRGQEETNDRVSAGTGSTGNEESGDGRGSEEGGGRNEMEELRAELERAQERTVELEQELERAREAQERAVEQLTQEVSQLTVKVKEEKDKYSMLWRLNCAQLTEHDETIARKEQEIRILQARVEALEADRGSGLPPTPVHHDGAGERTTPDPAGHTSRDVDREAVAPVSDPGRGPAHPLSSMSASGRGVSIPSAPSGPGLVGRSHPVVSGSGGILADHGTGRPPVLVPRESSAPASSTSLERGMRKGKAPPIDPFTGEDPEVRFEDWLPALTRAADWNRWTPEECLIQLAGHLRGRALQEWRLLQDEDKSDWDKAVAVLRMRLDPGSKVLAAQDFRHTTQKETETVADFIRRLERTFRIAYGSDNFTQETREALLYGQLQDGLLPDLMQSATVSGALTYRELCMAARTEEQRKAEMRKRRQYRSSDQRRDGRDLWKSDTRPKTQTGSAPKTKGGHGEPREAHHNKPTLATSVSQGGVRTCYQCGKPGHLAKDCRAPKTESQGRGSVSVKKVNPKTKQVTTSRTEEDSTSPEDPCAYLLEEGDVKLVQVQDQGSQPKCAPVQIGGVPALGIVDSGADITIVGKQLFLKIAAVKKLKKSECKPPDKTPKTYDRKPFSLQGMLQLDITFEGKKMSTTVYVKMDACDQLLLSEGVCRQLGILQYHPSVRPCSDENESEDVAAIQPSGGQPEPREVAIVPTVRVKLLQSRAVPPLQRVGVEVRAETEEDLAGPHVLTPQQLTSGVLIEPSLLNLRDGTAYLEVTNPTGYTQLLPEDLDLGTAVEATVIPDGPEGSDAIIRNLVNEQEETPYIKKVCSGQSEEWRMETLRKMFHPDLQLTEEEKEDFCQTLMQCHRAFSLEEGERGETDLVQFEIDTGDAPPTQQRPRRIPFALREEVSRQLKKMQESGVIQPSNSPWASPVVLVRKKDGTHRFCVDYREVTSVTKQDKFPLPRVDDLLDQLGETRYFSTLDLASGYWQIAVHPESRAKTAFVTHQGLHEFLVMPFGLTNAPSVFQRLMQRVLMGLNPEDRPDFVSVYIDDILVFSRTLSEHQDHVKRVLDRLIEVGLKLKPAKCQFIRQEVDFLGHVITPHGLKTSQRHITAITEFPVPKSVTEVRQFMGLSSYYRRFVRNFAQIAQPLHALTRKGATYAWSEACQGAFEELKKRLTAAPILIYPSFDRDFTLETDASILGIGAVLSQMQEDKKLHPVAFASRGLSPAERNYAITDLETLAVVWSVSHFRTYLYGQRVTIYTDHAAVKAVLRNPNASGRHARWWAKVHGSGLKEVNILYRAGKENAIADALSRNPHTSAPQEGIAEGETHVDRISEATDEEECDFSNLLQLEPARQPEGMSSLAVEQRKDSQLQTLIQYLEEGKLPDDPVRSKSVAAQSVPFVLLDGVLYLLDAKRNSRKRAVVPAHLKTKLMAEVHGGPMAGHFSGNRIFNTLSRSWWWKGMYQDIRNHCRNCPQCAVVTGASRPGRPPLQPIPVSQPFQIVGVDIMDLPKTAQGNKHVIVFQDFLTKWPVVVPMPDQKTTRIVRILVEEIIPMFGVPEALLSDRGTNLLSHLMEDVCGLLGIEKYNTTAYHPQCNGLVERFNRTLKTMLRKHAAKMGNQWDRYLHGVIWAYRNTPHESTHEKPSFLLFGMDCRSPTEAALLPAEEIEPADINDYRQELILALSHSRELAAKSIQGAQAKYKQNYDKKSRTTSYRLGEWVLIRFPQEESGANRKLSQPWRGPFRVVDSSETGVTAAKVYFPDEAPIQVHQSRVSRCPEAFPAGFYWYGKRRSRPGRPPRWVEQLLSDLEPEQGVDGCSVDAANCPQTEPGDIETPDAPQVQGASHVPPASCDTLEPVNASGQISPGQPSDRPVGNDQVSSLAPQAAEWQPGRADRRKTSTAKQNRRQSGEHAANMEVPPSMSRTRTRKVSPPDRLMMIRSGRANGAPGVCSS